MESKYGVGGGLKGARVSNKIRLSIYRMGGSRRGKRNNERELKIIGGK